MSSFHSPLRAPRRRGAPGSTASRRPWSSLTLLASFACALLVACTSSTTGNEGNLTFTYVADDALLDFNKPIAPGARLDLRVRAVGGGAVTITAATFDDASVLRVVDFDNGNVTVEGVSEGNALLSVTAELASGEVVSDEVNLLSRPPEVVELRHSCTTDDAAYYLTDQNPVFLAYEMRRENGQDVIGYGYFPVTFSDESAIVLDSEARDPQWMHLTTGSTPATVEVESTVDDTALTMELIEPGQIDGAQRFGNYGALVDIATFYYLIPFVGERPICQANTPFEITVSTPEVCEVTIVGDIEDGDPEPEEATQDTLVESGWIRVVGSQVDVCQFAVTYSEGGDGDGTTVDLEVDIIDIERPGDDAGGGADGGLDAGG